MSNSLLQQEYNEVMSKANKCDLHITVYDFSHDRSGNPTAHYVVRVKGKPYEQTGKRKQIGYSGDCFDGAYLMLEKLGCSIDDYEEELCIGSRSEGQIEIYMNKFFC